MYNFKTSRKIPEIYRHNGEKMERISDIIESIANEKNLEIEDVKERVMKSLDKYSKKGLW